MDHRLKSGWLTLRIDAGWRGDEYAGSRDEDARPGDDFSSASVCFADQVLAPMRAAPA